MAIPLYIFWFTIFEIVRIINSSLNLGLYIFTDVEMSFFKWFYAAIAILTGQHIAIIFWTTRVRRTYQMPFRLKIRLNNIINDNSSSLAVFLHWFLQVAFSYGFLISTWPNQSILGVHDLYQDYKYFFFFIILWLWLSSWTSIWRIFRTASYKWMALSVIVVVCSSFLLSQWNAVDYNAINNAYKKHHPIMEYRYNLPYSEIAQPLYKKSRVLTFYVGYKDQSKSSIPDILYYNNKIPADSLGYALSKLLQPKDEREIPYMTALFIADDQIPLSYINRLKNEVIKARILNISFGTKPQNAPQELRTLPNFNIGVSQRLIPTDSTDYIPLAFATNPLSPPPICVDCHSNEIRIEALSKDSIMVNDIRVSKDNISKQIGKEIARDSNYVITFYANKSMTLGEYLFFYNAPHRALKDLRNTMSKEIYGKHFKKLDKTERNKYPHLLRYKWVEKEIKH